MLQQVRWCLCSAQDGFSCLFSLRNAGLDTYLFLLWETPCCLQTLLWSDLCPVLAPMTPFFYANHTHLLPPLRHQGLCTCCFLELEFFCPDIFKTYFLNSCKYVFKWDPGKRMPLSATLFNKQFSVTLSLVLCCSLPHISSLVYVFVYKCLSASTSI